jgi:hypothetical protein
MQSEIIDTSEQKSVFCSEQIESLEQAMLQLPQAECPVMHYFGPGIYVREVALPAGTIAIGHSQRFEQLNVVLTGKVAMINEVGDIKEIVAPFIFVGPPGRKVGFVVEDTVWLNVYATEERDIDKLEAHFLDKSAAWQSHHQETQKAEFEYREKDREDFYDLIEQAGFSQETVRQQSENEGDQIDMPHGEGAKVTIRDSAIQGFGVFLSASAYPGEIIAPARINGMRTPVGRFTNHSANENAKFVKYESGDIYLVATRHINGCAGGGFGDEVTVNYRQALELSGFYLPKKELNQ